MASTTMVTQEIYAKHTQPKILNLVHARYGAFCGMNYQGNFHFGLGNASLSIPPGYPPYTPGAMCIPDYSATDGSIHIIYVLRFRGHLAENNLPAIFFSTSAISFHYFTSGTV
jgi:hypothetical protein